LGLWYAYERLNFTHYDLHTGNILVVPLEEKSVFVYKVDEVYHSVVAKNVFVIIDYGSSYVKIDNYDFKVNEYLLQFSIDQRKPNMYFDIYKLLMSIFTEVCGYKFELLKNLRVRKFFDSNRLLSKSFYKRI
jgi:hypothetical protein